MVERGTLEKLGAYDAYIIFLLKNADTGLFSVIQAVQFLVYGTLYCGLLWNCQGMMIVFFVCLF
jgi:hypothetical protein